MRFLCWCSAAIILASCGGAISQPNDALTYRPLVVNARRALDTLAARSDVDPKRLGVVGFSLGAQTAAAAGLRRATGSGAVARICSSRPEHATRWVPHAQLLALERAAPGHPRVRWYDDGHVVDAAIRQDQLSWQAAELGLR